MKIYHATTQKKAAKYQKYGLIKNPVRGFDNLQAAMFWAMKTGRKVIYEIEVTDNFYKLPDHHNMFGEAWWYDGDVSVNNIKCVLSAV